MPDPDLADDADGRAAPHRERDAVDGFDMADRATHEAALDREPDLEVVGGDQHRRVHILLGRRALGLGGEQRLGVGMLRRREHRLDIALLDDAPMLHHADLVGEAPHQTEVVGDEQHGHAIGLLHALEQSENLRLHGDVERRGRLVGDQEIGTIGERHGDHHALALAARQLMRKGAEPLGRIGNADLLQKLDDAGANLLRAARAVKLEDLADLPLDRMQRIERGHRLLKHHGDLAAANGAQLGVREL